MNSVTYRNQYHQKYVGLNPGKNEIVPQFTL